MSIKNIKNIVSKLFAGKPISKAYLFGSALNSFDEANDIDILLNLEPDSKFSLIDFSRLQIDLSDILGKPVDLLTEDSVSPYIISFIQKEKLLIYEK